MSLSKVLSIGVGGCFSWAVHKACKVKLGTVLSLLVQEYSLEAWCEQCWVTGRTAYKKAPNKRETQRETKHKKKVTAKEKLRTEMAVFLQADHLSRRQ